MMGLCFGGIPLALGVALYVVLVILILTWNLIKKNTKQLRRFLTMAGISSVLIVMLILLFLLFYAYLGCTESWWVELLIIFIGLPLAFSLASSESRKPRILSARVIKNCRFFGLIIFTAGSIFTLFVAYSFLENYF